MDSTYWSQTLKNILIVSLSPIASDPRVLRQISLLLPHCSVTVAGYSEYSHPEVKYIELQRPLRKLGIKRTINRIRTIFYVGLGIHKSYYWRTLGNSTLLTNLQFDEPFDFVIANDFDSAPIALTIPSKRYVLDAHEYTPDENFFSPSKVFFSRYKNWLCKEHIGRFDKVYTVSPGIARKYSEKYRVSPPEVLMNTPFYQSLNPSPTDASRVRLVHHGVAVRGRGIENIISLMDLLPNRFSLALYLVPTDEVFYSELVSMASGKVSVTFLKPVPTTEISRTINQYDIGIFLAPHLSTNHTNTLPNKFFEFIQARLMIAITPSLEMEKILNEFNLGVVFESFQLKEIAARLMQLDGSEISTFKTNSGLAAKELNWENQNWPLLNFLLTD